MGVERVVGTMLADNRGALGVMRGLGPVETVAISGGVREVVASVRAPVALAA
jgi:hypothetical protein